MAAGAAREAATHVPAAGASFAVSDFETVDVVASRELGFGLAREPFCTPSNNVALALEASETLRVLLKHKSRKGDFVRHQCGVNAGDTQGATEPPIDEFDKPCALLPIVDVKVKLLEPADAGERLPGRCDARLLAAALTVTVAGDAPCRVVDLLERFATDANHRAGAGPASERARRAIAVADTVRMLALVSAGATRATEVNEQVLAITAGNVNSAISSAKRILVGDLNLRLNLTLFQAYRVGTNAVPRTFELSRWSGAYGAGFDIGSSGGIGIRASSVTADRRNHGKVLMTQAEVDDWCGYAAARHFVEMADGTYAPRPRETRGVPHLTIPGVHAYLDPYVDALEHARTLLGLEERFTVDSVQVLPLGPFAERQFPHIHESADVTSPRRFRNPVDRQFEGRAYQSDGTASDVALFREPLAPLPAVTAPEDNCFATCQSALASAFGAAAALAVLARLVARTAFPSRAPAVRDACGDVALLHAHLVYFYAASAAAPPPTEAPVPLLFVAHAGLFLNAIFLSAHGLSDLAINEGHSRAPALVAEHMRTQERRGESAVGAPLRALVSEEAFAVARRFWMPFERTKHLSPWRSVAPLLQRFLETDGSLDLSLAALSGFSDEIERVIKDSFLFASADGMAAPVAPHPLAGVTSASAVRAEHVVPKITPRLREGGVVEPAQATLVGLPALGFQQLLNLLMAASTDASTDSNVSLNFGYLVLRPSAAPDVLTLAASQRSSKAISALNVEGDEAQFGSRSEKLLTTRLQRAAWAWNVRAVRNLCLDVSPPLSDARRSRGELEINKFCRNRQLALNSEGRESTQQVRAEQAFERAYDAGA
jgi:hypothetical protein